MFITRLSRSFNLSYYCITSSTILCSLHALIFIFRAAGATGSPAVHAMPVATGSVTLQRTPGINLFTGLPYTPK